MKKEMKIDLAADASPNLEQATWKKSRVPTNQRRIDLRPSARGRVLRRRSIDYQPDLAMFTQSMLFLSNSINSTIILVLALQIPRTGRHFVYSGNPAFGKEEKRKKE